MAAFRIFLLAMICVLVIYTIVVISNHGMGLLPIFFGDIAAMNWPGQFNLDFFGFLLMSGLWVAWRHHFTFAGLALGLVAVFGGIGFLAPYLLIQSFRTKGNMRIVMLGERRAADV